MGVARCEAMSREGVLRIDMVVGVDRDWLARGRAVKSGSGEEW